MDDTVVYQKQIYALIQQICENAGMPLLPKYLPGLLAVFSGYQLVYVAMGPWLSTTFLPKAYPNFRGSDKLRWDENVVSLIQALVICTLSAQIMLFDEDRRNMTWQERTWGYSEPAAMVLTVANGYFYWHTMMMIRFREVFGWAMVAHGVAVSVLMTTGYRPTFLTYSTPSFLYEFSTIFLDIQFILRSLQMEGTMFQIINGLGLFLSFFLARVVFGTYLQACFYVDIWRTFVATKADIPFGRDRIPTWLLATHALSGITLQALNYMWFYKICKVVQKKFFAKKEAQE